MLGRTWTHFGLVCWLVLGAACSMLPIVRQPADNPSSSKWLTTSPIAGRGWLRSAPEASRRWRGSECCTVHPAPSGPSRRPRWVPPGRCSMGGVCVWQGECDAWNQSLCIPVQRRADHLQSCSAVLLPTHPAVLQQAQIRRLRPAAVLVLRRSHRRAACLRPLC